MNDYIKNHEEEFDKSVEFFKNELTKIRTGRANPNLVEGLLVEVYGTPTPILQVASISVPEARIIQIEPWDKNVIKDIEKTISNSNLGVSVSSDTSLVRVIFPQMTEETRQQFIKMLAEQLEKAKISIRQIRDSVKEEIEKAFKTSDITEDDRYDYRKELDDHVDTINKDMDTMAKKKDEEIMTI
jgi:ribosome recycling factor